MARQDKCATLLRTIGQMQVYDGVKDLNPAYLKITDHNNPKGEAQVAAQLDFNRYVIQVGTARNFIHLTLLFLIIHIAPNCIGISLLDAPLPVQHLMVQQRALLKSVEVK